jgi:hypothetical protein
MPLSVSLQVILTEKALLTPELPNALHVDVE